MSFDTNASLKESTEFVWCAATNKIAHSSFKDRLRAALLCIVHPLPVPPTQALSIICLSLYKILVGKCKIRPKSGCLPSGSPSKWRLLCQKSISTKESPLTLFPALLFSLLRLSQSEQHRRILRTHPILLYRDNSYTSTPCVCLVLCGVEVH
ncbi:hypothetical protein BDY19DRAFT_980479 [Irpex rosettiformis]|uniref:Uncharacterized protein n=1 Tax=Irpex rosettiformis TaxID=378272 RepID=A0ACB8TMH6_9APHY|nr:hypothetical protein BDY19DRAFT_980479 [Irpex rosettiformis]